MKVNEECSDDDSAAARKNAWNIPNFTPKPVDGEDESTLRKHEKLLQVYFYFTKCFKKRQFSGLSKKIRDI